MPGKPPPLWETAAGATPAAGWRIQEVSVLPNHQLALTFRDGLTGTADFSAIEKSTNPGIYAPLVDSAYFGRVQIELGALAWPNGADIDPAWLHESLVTNKTWALPF